MITIRSITFFILFYLVTLISQGASAEIIQRNNVIEINGEISIDDALLFERIVNQHNPRIIHLNSPGGLVREALKISKIIHEKKIGTYIDDNAICMSACFFIFISGTNRIVNGELGVHQMSIPGENQGNLDDTQKLLHQINDIFINANLSPYVFQRMLATPKDAMHIFTREEIADLNIGKALSEKRLSEKNKRLVQNNDILLVPRAFSKRSFEIGYNTVSASESTNVVGDYDIYSEYSSDTGIRYVISVNRVSYNIDGNKKGIQFGGKEVFELKYDFNGNLLSVDIIDKRYYSSVNGGKKYFEQLLYYLIAAAPVLNAIDIVGNNIGNIISGTRMKIGAQNFAKFQSKLEILLNSNAMKSFQRKYSKNAASLLKILDFGLKFAEQHSNKLKYFINVGEMKYSGDDILFNVKGEKIDSLTLDFPESDLKMLLDTKFQLNGTVNVSTGLPDNIEWSMVGYIEGEHFMTQNYYIKEK